MAQSQRLCKSQRKLHPTDLEIQFKVPYHAVTVILLAYSHVGDNKFTTDIAIKVM